MMKGINIEEIKKVIGGSVCDWRSGCDVAQEKNPVSWPNRPVGWVLAEAGPLATCDPPCQAGVRV